MEPIDLPSRQIACPRPLPFEILQKPPANEECEPPIDISLFEDTPLYALISQKTRASMKKAYNLVCNLRNFQIKKRSEVDRSTYLHHVVNQAAVMYKKYSTVADLIPLMYKLCLKGVVVNAQNKHGNTCLHLACIRPHAEPLCIHLLRLGGLFTIYYYYWVVYTKIAKVVRENLRIGKNRMFQCREYLFMSNRKA